MRVPLSWLREFVDCRVAPRQLADDLTIAGLAVDAIETAGADSVFDIDVTTNRVDCMNVYGVAREVATVYDLPLKPLELSIEETGPAAAEALRVEVDAPDLCTRFCARVLDVRIGPSPAWLRERLELVGVRPINNVVDLTNYVMIEMGQPCHAFDLERIPGARLRVRWAMGGEKLKTLDGVMRTLSARTGVVADAEAALALAGIMGGASSEVSEATRVVALEAAHWDPLTVRRAAKALGMHTEASHRFERSADPEAPPLAAARFAQLAAKIGAGSTRPGLIDVRPVPAARRTVRLRPARCSALLGTAVTVEASERILGNLGFRTLRRMDADLQVDVPSWRSDVVREVDLIEEVGRHHRLDRIPSSVPPSRGAEGLRPWQVRERRLRETLLGADFDEVVTYAFVSAASAADAARPLVELANPLSEEQAVLRPAIVVPGLLRVLAANRRQGVGDAHLFEIGRVFAPSGSPLPREERRLGLLLAGHAAPIHWSEKPRSVDLFDAKGLLDAVCERLETPRFEWSREGLPPLLHPGRSAVLRQGAEVVGYCGSLHPDAAERWELRGDVIVAEIGLDRILGETPAAARFRPLPRQPEVTRDLSIVWDEERSAAELESQISAAGGPLLRSLVLTDRYAKPPVPAGRVSLTVSLHFQDPERTLTGEEVQAAIERVVAALKAEGAEIRGE